MKKNNKPAVKKAPVKKSAAKKTTLSTDQKLTVKQRLFVREYLVDLNATQAAIRAGYSKKTAKVIGCQNLTKLNVIQSVFESMENREKNVETSAEWVLKALHGEAIADIADLYDKLGSLKPIHDWPIVWRTGLVTGVKTKQEHEYIDGQKVPNGVVTEIKLSDRVKRLELIGKHHAMFTDNVNLGGEVHLRDTSDSNLDAQIIILQQKVGKL
jgi:phage terminase small subunit